MRRTMKISRRKYVVKSDEGPRDKRKRLSRTSISRRF